ncbi:hypothetical protein FOCC_FOCC000768 [Frankliniella occidentalis]|nr:hypothetical protein FOCC_FOCC000768 [Frankliniella occidentalis]
MFARNVGMSIGVHSRKRLDHKPAKQGLKRAQSFGRVAPSRTAAHATAKPKAYNCGGAGEEGGAGQWQVGQPETGTIKKRERIGGALKNKMGSTETRRSARHRDFVCTLALRHAVLDTTVKLVGPHLFTAPKVHTALRSARLPYRVPYKSPPPARPAPPPPKQICTRRVILIVHGISPCESPFFKRYLRSASERVGNPPIHSCWRVQQSHGVCLTTRFFLSSASLHVAPSVVRRRVQRGSLSQVGPLTETLLNHVLEFLQDHVSAVPEERAHRLRSACERLRADATKQHPEPADMAASLAAVRAALTATVDAILEKQVQRRQRPCLGMQSLDIPSELVNVLEGPASPLSLRTAVSALCALGRQGSALSDLVVRCGGVRALLQVVLDARTSHTRRAALRALSAVCCTAKSVRSLEQAGGVEVVAELLSESKRPEEERAEAAAVLAQITAPWVPDNARVEGLSEHLDTVVHALTKLVRGASSGEVLLLGAAALAHLSYVESSAVWPLLTAGAPGAVLQAVRAQGARCSVFLQEQAATLVANMSAVPEARAELAAERAVVALLCFLQLRPSPLQRAADIAAAERVQHKAAIALSRMASDPEVARQVVSLEGVPRLVRLCRDEKERNHSDGVLVACLAALRKIAANCGTVVLSKRDRRELLEPRLLDSFMLFSTRQESYV